MNVSVLTQLFLFSDVDSVNKSLSFGITLANQCICFQMCVYLCCAEQINNYFAKCAYFCLLLFTSIILYTYCMNGQKIINENEKIQSSLVHCSWINKPKWFKKTLIIMMIKANASLEIKPYGLYVLNLANYSSIMNAAYSFFNVLSSLRSSSMVRRVLSITSNLPLQHQFRGPLGIHPGRSQPASPITLKCALQFDKSPC
ncbi:uncharacterized protein LOC142317522 [Lycorma delicatula]|uniref:uncharacterized protein LOC142317522 n=1 Tax=Lycorma delicatula TaxID=130591 RepID=UPI003F5142EB